MLIPPGTINNEGLASQINRSRYIGPAIGDGTGFTGIALNGRKGRRVGCVSIGDGSEVGVWDMDEQEEDEDEEEGEEGEGQEDESM